MTIILSGGGSGGHITPILAVASSLKKLDPQSKVIYIGQKGDTFVDIPRADPNIDAVYVVRAGKYRRYYGEGLRQIFDLKTLALNCRDFTYLLIGIAQSRRLIHKLKPTILFTRGGFVSVPVAIGARMNKVPYITHDSDSVPSLANRLIAKKAIKHFVAMEENLYPYPLAKTINTGIPITGHFKAVSPQEKRAFRKDLSIAEDAKVLFVIGGGLGAQGINQAVIEAASNLLTAHPDLYIFHVAGTKNESSVKEGYIKSVGATIDRVKVFGYISDVYKYSAAADLIIARAGATNIAEFAAQAKPCIIIPSGALVGGHQLKNASVLERAGAAVVVSEKDLVSGTVSLEEKINQLLNNPEMQQSLSVKIAKFAKPKAAETIAKLILSLGNSNEA